MTPNEDPADPEFLTVEDVAARLKVREKTVRDWILRGTLEAYKIGKEWRIRRDHLDRHVEERRVSAQPAATGCRDAGVRPVRFHDLRHTFGTRLAASGESMRTIQEFLGHADSKTTQIYTHYPPSEHEVEMVNRAFALGVPWNNPWNKLSETEKN